MSLASAQIVVVTADPSAVLPSDSGLQVSMFAQPNDALAHLGDLRAKGAPAVFVLARADINRHALVMDLITRHPDVPIVVAGDTSVGPMPGYAVTRPAQSRALVEAITDASRTAIQRSRVRTTIDRLNVRIAAAVTDPRQQQGLVLSQLYLESILQQAQEAIFVADRTGVVALWNPAAARLFGMSAHEIVGHSIERASVELLDHVRALSATTPARLADLAVSSPNGVITCELSIGLVFDPDRNPVAVSGIARDVTERRALLRTVEERAQALAEANRHKDEFLAVLSHELRTPLNVVLGWAHMLEEAASSEDDDLRRGLAMIRRNTELQQRLVDDLLDYARIAAGRLALQFEAVDVAEVVRSTVDGLRRSNEENELTWRESYEHVPRTWADSSRLRQVIANLVSNAIKFTPERGVIAVSVRHVAGDIQIVVADTGQGISKEFLPHIFDEFKQANPSTTRKLGGLGLGLAISRRIVDLHHGRITAASEGAGRGATFTVVLPVRQAPMLQPADPASAAANPRD